VAEDENGGEAWHGQDHCGAAHQHHDEDAHIPPCDQLLLAELRPQPQRERGERNGEEEIGP